MLISIQSSSLFDTDWPYHPLLLFVRFPRLPSTLRCRRNGQLFSLGTTPTWPRNHSSQTTRCRCLLMSASRVRCVVTKPALRRHIGFSTLATNHRRPREQWLNGVESLSKNDSLAKLLGMTSIIPPFDLLRGPRPQVLPFVPPVDWFEGIFLIGRMTPFSSAIFAARHCGHGIEASLFQFWKFWKANTGIKNGQSCGAQKSPSISSSLSTGT